MQPFYYQAHCVACTDQVRPCQNALILYQTGALFKKIRVKYRQSSSRNNPPPQTLSTTALHQAFAKILTVFSCQYTMGQARSWQF